MLAYSLHHHFPPGAVSFSIKRQYEHSSHSSRGQEILTPSHPYIPSRTCVIIEHRLVAEKNLDTTIPATSHGLGSYCSDSVVRRYSLVASFSVCNIKGSGRSSTTCTLYPIRNCRVHGCQQTRQCQLPTRLSVSVCSCLHNKQQFPSSSGQSVSGLASSPSARCP